MLSKISKIVSPAFWHLLAAMSYTIIWQVRVIAPKMALPSFSDFTSPVINNQVSSDILKYQS